MTGPFCASMTRFVVATSSASDVRGFCTAITGYPSSSRIGISFAQLLPSANAPWTRTIVGFDGLADPTASKAKLRRSVSVFMRPPEHVRLHHAREAGSIGRWYCRRRVVDAEIASREPIMTRARHADSPAGLAGAQAPRPC